MDYEVESLASTMASAGVSERTVSSSENSGVETGGTGLEGKIAATVDDGRPCEWTKEEAKLAGPCLTLIQVPFVSNFKIHIKTLQNVLLCASFPAAVN